MKIVVERGLLPGHKTSTWAHVRQVTRGEKEKVGKEGADAMSVNKGREKGNFSGENQGGARGVLAGSARSVGRGREPEEAPVYTAL